MIAKVIDKSGKLHIFKYECQNPAEAFGALVQWFGGIRGIDPSNIKSLECDPDKAILPFFGEASLSQMLMTAAGANPIKF